MKVLVNREVVKMRLEKLCEEEPTVDSNVNLLLLRYWMRFDGLKTTDSIANVMGFTPANDIISMHAAVKAARSGQSAVKTSGKSGQAFLDLS